MPTTSTASSNGQKTSPLLYNISSDGLNRGEMSRFMLQFLVESPHNISLEYLEAGQSPQQALEIEIHKTPEMLQQMFDAYDIHRCPQAFFSPSALNAYLDCRLKFYYRYVAGLKALDEVSAEIDSTSSAPSSTVLPNWCTTN